MNDNVPFDQESAPEAPHAPESPDEPFRSQAPWDPIPEQPRGPVYERPREPVYERPRESAYEQPRENPRRESPYANSPYVIREDPRQQEYYYRPETVRKPPKQEKERKPIWKPILSLCLVALLVTGGCLITAGRFQDQLEQQKALISEQSQKLDALQKQLQTPGLSDGSYTQSLPADGSALAPRDLYARNVNSVVAIFTTVRSASFYGTTEGTASGSGFILTEDGYVITNHHVVEGATKIKVTMYDGTEYDAEVKGSDSTNDIAVLKVDAEGLPAASLGSSSDLVIGDMVVAIGNPLGELAATQTVGYVSGINREVTTDNTIINMIQTDAAINPGNSGGPLFNMQGEVVGITTAKYSGTTGSGASIEGIGFAIPIDDVVTVINDLVEFGHVTGAYLGVTVQNTDESSAAMFGLPTGAYVVEVNKDGSADKAGIQSKDIIIKLGDTTVANVTELTRALRKFKAGDETTVTVIRSGKELVLNITLDERPADLDNTDIPQPNEDMPSEGNYEDWFNWFFGNQGG